MCICVYIYIYIQRERERESCPSTYIVYASTSVYLPMFIYTYKTTVVCHSMRYHGTSCQIIPASVK